MTSETTITFEGDHIKVVDRGDKNLEHAREMWTDVSLLCQKHACYNVLGLSYADNAMPILDGYSHAELFRDLGITAGYRIAWVEHNAEAREHTDFVETVLFNRGLPGRSFASEEEARAWLLGADDAAIS